MIFILYYQDPANAIVFNDHLIPPPLMNYYSDRFRFVNYFTAINFCNFVPFLDLLIID